MENINVEILKDKTVIKLITEQVDFSAGLQDFLKTVESVRASTNSAITEIVDREKLVEEDDVNLDDSDDEENDVERVNTVDKRHTVELQKNYKKIKIN